MNPPEGIATQAAQKASDYRAHADRQRAIAAMAIAKTGHTALAAAWQSNRPAIDGFRDHYLSEAERFDALASAWQERADAAREGRILRTANDPPGWIALLPTVYQ